MSNGDKPFKDKVGLVTGSARGIGRSIAEDLADWGANIVVLDVKQADCDKTAAEIADRIAFWRGVQVVEIDRRR